MAGVQLRYKTGLTGDDYVSREAWREASLAHCPLHPDGGCGLVRHGTYPRATPPGARVARWYCPTAPCTISLLPDCLAARLPGTLESVEAVVASVESAPSVEAAADRLRPEIDLPGAIRWTRRRVQRVHGALSALRGLMPYDFVACPATVAGFRARLGVEPVLPALRARATTHLADLPAPLGFRPHLLGAGEARGRRQHEMGPDPPPASR